MDKLTIAHDWAMVCLKSGLTASMEELIIEAWQYADAMQAEAHKRKPSGLPDALKEEWQPDWSQAPDDLVKYFAVDESGRGGWFISKPILCSDHWYWSDFEERFGNDCYDHAPSFGYTGNWQDSLRERPHGK